MKRLVTAAIAASLLAGAMGPPSNAEEARQGESRRESECRFQHLDRATWTPREEWRTAKCVVERWPIYGGLTKLLDVGSCESGMNRFAYNSAGPYVGLFQHALPSWTYRVSTYEPEWWALRPRWQNSRTAITVTVKMVQAVGWSPWTCS
jgi:Ni/Co efflux regulator RcnB